MATIASLSVQLAANPAALVAGLNVAKGAIAKTGASMAAIANRVGSTVAGIGSHVASGDFTGALRSSIDAAGGLASKLASVAGAAVGLPGIGAAVGAGIQGAIPVVDSLISGLMKVKTLFNDGAGKALAMRNASITLNESFQETAALAMAAGGDAERMTRAMVHMNETIQSARMGDSGAIAQLSGRLQLNVEDLAKVGTAQRLETVIKALGSLNDELTKSATEMGIFGERSALAFGPLLASGKGLAQFREQVERFGFDLGTASSGEAKAMTAQILEAKRAVNQLALAWDGIKMNLAAGLAPVLTQTAKLFSGLGVDAKNIQNWSGKGAMVLAKAGAAAFESWKMLKNLWDYLKIGFLEMLAGFDEGLKSLFENLSKLPDFLGGTINAQLAQDVGREIKGLRAAIDATWKSIEDRKKERSAFDSVNDWFNRIQQQTTERKKLAEQAEKNRKNYEPMRAPIQLTGAAEFGSQDAYKTIGQFLAGQNASMAQRQLQQAQRIEEAVRRGDVTLKDIKTIIKRGIIRKGKI